MRTSFISILSFTSFATLAACSDPDLATGDVAEDLTNTPCATLPADASFTVPETFTSTVIYSSSGDYGYVRRGALSTCRGFIVDVSMTTVSNLNPDPHGVPTNPDGRLALFGEAYDLPSSAKANGTIPTTKNDCTRYSGALYFYTWPHTDTGYTYIGGALYGGSWDGTACNIAQSSQPPFTIPHAFASSAGVDKYRVVYGVIERTTYQEAGVVLSQLPPQ